MPRQSTKILEVETQGVSFILSLNTLGLSHREPVCAGTSRKSCRAQKSNERDTL